MPSSRDRDSAWYALSLAWELGYMIALPIVIFGFSGAYLDKKFATGHWFISVGIILSILISTFSVYRKVKTLS